MQYNNLMRNQFKKKLKSHFAFVKKNKIYTFVEDSLEIQLRVKRDLYNFRGNEIPTCRDVIIAKICDTDFWTHVSFVFAY